MPAHVLCRKYKIYRATGVMHCIHCSYSAQNALSVYLFIDFVFYDIIYPKVRLNVATVRNITNVLVALVSNELATQFNSCSVY